MPLLSRIAARAVCWASLSAALAGTALAQSPGQTNPTTATKKSPPQAAQPAQTQPPSVQSKHYPILLIASGTNPAWSARIGMKGVERIERSGYPSLPLEAGTIDQDATANAWTYHAKDSATGADVALHLSRENCSDGTSGTRYTFRAVVEHAQIGSLQGCARMAPDEFPEFKQKNLDDDDPAKKKPAAPAITNSKPPTIVAYLDAAGRVIWKYGETVRVVAPKGYQLSLSHDGKRLLFTHDEKGTEKTILLYDSATGKTSELLRGSVQQPAWSPDDSRFAFLKLVDAKWQIWVASPASPAQGAVVYAENISAIDGWADSHTLIADDLKQLLWIGDDGKTMQSLSEKDLFGEAFSPASTNTVRLHPLNPDLLLVSAGWTKAPTDPQTGSSLGFFLYEIHSKRRVLLGPLTLLSKSAEWSRDGLQIFFTAVELGKSPVIDRIFWDGSGLKRYIVGTDLVIGQ